MSAFLHSRQHRRSLLVGLAAACLAVGSVYVIKQVSPFRVKLMSKSVLLCAPPPKDILDPLYAWIDDSHLLEHWFVREGYRQDMLTVYDFKSGTYRDLNGINIAVAKTVVKRVTRAARLLLSPDKSRLLIANYFGSDRQDFATISVADIKTDTIVSSIEDVPVDMLGGIYWSDDSKSWTAMKIEPGHAGGEWRSTSFTRDGAGIGTSWGNADAFAIPHVAEAISFSSSATDQSGTKKSGAFQGLEPGGFRIFSPNGKQAAWMTVNFPDPRAKTFIGKQLQLLLGLNKWQAEIHLRNLKLGTESVIASLFESDTGPPNHLFEFRMKRHSLRWMPDGKRLSFILDGKLYAIPVD